ncbi:lipoprotein [Sporichthya brevicatena]|uniref:Lipoprotein n=1 Tax=Sporichthya brevicatena TaxID=171442 RepID=A0ABN1GK81_9ACTN
MSARRTHRFRAAAVSTAAVLAFAGLAGCNGSDSATDRAAAELESMTPVAAIQKVADAAAKDSAAYTFEVTGSGVSVKGSGAYRGGDRPAARMVFDSMKMMGISVPAGTEFRLVDDVMYLKITKGGLIPGLGTDGGWLSLPLDDAKSEGADIAGIDPTMANPVEQLQKMLDTQDVSKVGTETIDGVKTTHYRAKINPEGTGTVTEKKSSTHSNELSRQLEEQLEKSIKDSMGLSEPVTVDAWVDGDYRARKLAVTLPMAGEFKMTMKFTDFGSDVKVDVPADAKKFDVGALLSDALGGKLEDAFGGDLAKQFGEDFDKQISEQLERSLGENFSSDLSEQFAERLREQMEQMSSGGGRAS